VREGLSLAYLLGFAAHRNPVRRFQTDVGFTIHFDGLPTKRPSGTDHYFVWIVKIPKWESFRSALHIRSRSSALQL
jgi:hypothetical protein